MHLKYTITIDDLLAFSRYHCMKSPALKRSRIIGIGIVFALPVAASLAIDPGPHLSRAFIVGIAVLIAIPFALFSPHVFRWNLDRNVRRMYGEGA